MACGTSFLVALREIWLSCYLTAWSQSIVLVKLHLISITLYLGVHRECTLGALCGWKQLGGSLGCEVAYAFMVWKVVGLFIIVQYKINVPSLFMSGYLNKICGIEIFNYLIVINKIKNCLVCLASLLIHYLKFYRIFSVL